MILKYFDLFLVDHPKYCIIAKENLKKLHLIRRNLGKKNEKRLEKREKVRISPKISNFTVLSNILYQKTLILVNFLEIQGKNPASNNN